MAHVKISKSGMRPASVVVDGVEMKDHIYAHGFAVDVGEFDQEASVSMIVAADVLEVDLPDAVLKAVRATDDEVSAMIAESKDDSA